MISTAQRLAAVISSRAVLVGILLLGWSGCTSAPGSVADAGIPAGDGIITDGSTLIAVNYARPFGKEGETPTHLVMAGVDGTRLLALTDHAVYLLDDGGRQLNRFELPVSSAGARAVVTSAVWDGVGLGATVRWGTDTAVAAGTYLALSDAKGIFKTGSMVPVGPVSSAALSRWDGAAHRVLWTKVIGANQVDLRESRVPRAGAVTTRTLVSGLAIGAVPGDWQVDSSGDWAICTTEVGGRVKLRTSAPGGGSSVKSLNDAGRDALGYCHMATSGRSFLTIWTQRALPPELLDAGVGAPDLGPGSLSFDYPVAQLVNPKGETLAGSVRLSMFKGTVRVESVLWDGARFLVLLNAVGYRGGRMVLTAFDETGTLLFRDRVIDLEYEPGRLVAGRLAMAGTKYFLLYSSRRPWDEGVLHLSRFFLPTAP